ncbi:MAG: hypothetical protein FJ405_00840 [Verrucomicrobia bacterium]|nr:hypothetical protein [Verrucomicrobiota bacterium]
MLPSVAHPSLARCQGPPYARWFAACAMFCFLVFSGAADSPPRSPISALAFAPDNKSLLAASGSRLMHRAVPDFASLGDLSPGLKRCSCVAFHPAGRWLAVGGGTPGSTGAVAILEWPSGKRVASLGGFDDIVMAAMFDPSGGVMVVTSADGSARLWAVDVAAKPAEGFIDLRGHTGPVLAAAFSPGGDRLVTAGEDRSLRVWGTKDGKLERILSHHTDRVNTLVTLSTPQGGSGPSVPWMCASGADDRTVRIWQPSIGRMVRIIRRHEGSVLSLGASSGVEGLYSGSTEGVVRKLSPASDVVSGEWQESKDWIQAVRISSDGRWLATGDAAGQIRLRELPR